MNNMAGESEKSPQEDLSFHACTGNTCSEPQMHFNCFICVHNLILSSGLRPKLVLSQKYSSKFPTFSLATLRRSNIHPIIVICYTIQGRRKHSKEGVMHSGAPSQAKNGQLRKLKWGQST